MNNAMFLLAAVGASVLGSIVLWLRQRTPRDTMSSIDEFQREMHALSRETEEPPARPRRRTRPEPIIPAEDPEQARRRRDANRERPDG